MRQFPINVIYSIAMGARLDRLKARIKGLARKKTVNNDRNNDNGILSARLSDDAKRLVEQLFAELGPRPAATKESRRAARRIASIFEQYTDDVTITSTRIFTSVAKGILLSLLLLSSLVFLFTLFNLPIISLSLLGLWGFSFYMQIKRKRNIFKVFIPSDEASNVHCVLEPEGVVEETIVFTAHHDTAPENKTNKTFSFKYFTLYYLPIAGCLILGITSLFEFLSNILQASSIPSVASFSVIAFSSVGLIFTYSSLFSIKTLGKRFVTGAGDNLSGVSVVVQLLRYFSDKKKRGHGLKHTRLVFASFDGEECGTQGSFAWFSSNTKLLCNAKVVNFDGLYKAEDLAFLTQDGNGLVPLSAPLAARCAEIAHSMGYEIETGKLGIMAGETDASSAAKAGYKATTLTSMRPEVKTPAHTLDDTPDKIEPEALSEAVAIGIKLAESEDLFWLNSNNDSQNFLDGEKKYRLTK